MAEITLFDSTGSAIAYIADDAEQTIYLWHGEAVAYLSQALVYGFNGKHLGWFDLGILRDKRGSPVGFTRNTCPHPTKAEPAKHVKKVKKVKTVRSVASTRVANTTVPSTLSLNEFLQSGQK